MVLLFASISFICTLLMFMCKVSIVFSLQLSNLLFPVFGHLDNPCNLSRFPKVVVISYTMLHRLRRSILQQKWSLLIVDESHHVRCSKKSSEPEEVKVHTVFRIFELDAVFFFHFGRFFFFSIINWFILKRFTCNNLTKQNNT